MNYPKITLWRILSRKLAVIVLLAVSAYGAYATLGDGKTRSNTHSSLLSNKTTIKPRTFSLRSGYSYRGNQVINTQSERRYINLNTVVTLQKGNTTFIVPLKKQVVFDKVKIEFGNRQFQRP